jgi:hypothetical protein
MQAEKEIRGAGVLAEPADLRPRLYKEYYSRLATNREAQ